MYRYPKCRRTQDGMLSNSPHGYTPVPNDLELLPSDASCISALVTQSYDPIISQLEEKHLQSSSLMSSTDHPDCDHITIAGAEYVLMLSHCCPKRLQLPPAFKAMMPHTPISSYAWPEYIYLKFHSLRTTMAHLSPANVHEKMSTSLGSRWRRCRKLSRPLRARKKETRRQNWMS